MKCWLDLDKTVNQLVRLGFDINWDKVDPPNQDMSFLGVNIDTVKRTLSLPNKKYLELQGLVSDWAQKRRVSKKDLQRFLGKLNWAARVIRGGRTFMRRLIDLTCKLKAAHHRIWLNSEARADITWWLTSMSVFHGSTKFVSDLLPPSSQM